MTGALSALARERHIVVCCGSGGVGKTTAAAAFALEAARAGRDAVVVTIDPAKRLANALGIDFLSDTASEIDRSRWDPAGDAEGDGRLSALMLDTKSTFDRLVLKYSPDAGQGQRILDNRFYRNISGALSGTQEYMAMEQLHELHQEGNYDVIVVDTPPTRNALDFLDAPERLTRLLDNKLFRLVMAPTRAGFKVANFALTAFFRTVSKIIGAEVVEDLVMFFRAFEGMEDGFRQRARQVTALLADRRTAFVLVTSPRRDALAEAGFFARRLKDSGLLVDALIVNRVSPDFGDGSAEEARKQAASLPPGPEREGQENLADFLELSARERRHLAGVAQQVGAVPVVRVPLLPVEVADLEGLRLVGDHLFGPDES